jgi:polysaccharide export outer membrane protein
VRAVGRTPSELARIIAARYSRGKFLQEPQVTVTVVEYRPIYDALTRSRRLLKPEGSLTAAAGTGVLVQHVGDQVWNEYPLLSSIEILPGDIIRIPERYF